MDTMNIALPESMKHFVQERVTEGGYSSVSEYIRDLIRADLVVAAHHALDAELAELLDQVVDERVVVVDDEHPRSHGATIVPDHRPGPAGAGG